MAPCPAPGRAVLEHWDERLRKEVQAALRELRRISPESPDRTAALVRLNGAVARLNALVLDHHLPEE